MTSQFVVIEELESFRAAADRAREIANRVQASVSVRRTPTGWAVLIADDANRETSISANTTTYPLVQDHVNDRPVLKREISESQLLVLKSFYMGHAISEKPSIRASAIKMIDAAIDHLRQSESTQWLVFYLMMRAEIARQTNESPVGLRKWIRDLDTDMYEMFMAVEGATQRTKRLDGIKEVTIVEPPVVLTESYLVTDGWRTWVVGHDLACRALGIDDDDISAKQREFLGRTTLKDLLESHGVPLSF